MLERPILVNRLDVITGFTFGHKSHAHSEESEQRKPNSKRLEGLVHAHAEGLFATTQESYAHKPLIALATSGERDKLYWNSIPIHKRINY